MRRTSMWAAATLFTSGQLLFAQQAAQQSKPPLPADILGTQLVAWSELQKPRPVPQPLPPPQPQPDPSAQPQTPPQGSQGQQQPSTQPFTGTIVKDGGKYILKVSESSSYQIDDQERAKLFEGKQVKISGSLDEKTNVLHVTSIELLS